MQRSDLLEVVKELYEVLERKKVSPNEAKNIACIFQKSIEENNESAIKDYMENGTFEGSPPIS